MAAALPALGMLAPVLAAIPVVGDLLGALTETLLKICENVEVRASLCVLKHP